MKGSDLSRLNLIQEEYFYLALKHQGVDDEKSRIYSEKHDKYLALFYNTVKKPFKLNIQREDNGR